MSRSYKKIPCIKNPHKDEKKYANRIVRQYKGDLSNGKLYRKLYPQYDIYDWKICRSFRNFKLDQERFNKMIKNETYYFYYEKDIKDINSKEFYKKWYTKFKGK